MQHRGWQARRTLVREGVPVGVGARVRARRRRARRGPGAGQLQRLGGECFQDFKVFWVLNLFRVSGSGRQARTLVREGVPVGVGARVRARRGGARRGPGAGQLQRLGGGRDAVRAVRRRALRRGQHVLEPQVRQQVPAQAYLLS